MRNMPKARVVVVRRKKNLSLKTKKRKRKNDAASKANRVGSVGGKGHGRRADGGGKRASARSPTPLTGRRGDDAGAVPTGALQGDAEARRILAMPPLVCPDFLKSALPQRQDSVLMGALLPAGRTPKWRGMFGRAPPVHKPEDDANVDAYAAFDEGNADVDGEGGRLGLSEDGFCKLEKFGFGHLYWSSLFSNCSVFVKKQERDAPLEPGAQGVHVKGNLR